jgi:hypothetical protein
MPRRDDPATGNWTVTGSLNNARFLHTATLLSDGRVLAAGGNNNRDILASAELNSPRQQHAKSQHSKKVTR